jgi:hypothetical protein
VINLYIWVLIILGLILDQMEDTKAIVYSAACLVIAAVLVVDRNRNRRS